MSVVSVMQCLPKLKTILQSKITIYVLFIFLIFYVLITTVLIKYESVYESPTELVGIITDLNVKEDKITFILKAKENVQCSYYFKEGEDVNYLLGKKVKVLGKVSDVSNNTIPNTFNYKKYLYRSKIYLSFKVSSIEILSNENIFYALKNKMLKRINSYDDEIKTYLNLFILGDKTYLDSDLYTAYRTNGIWHLFAVSGMHIGLIIAVLDKLLKKVKRKKLIISGVLSYFMFLTSFSASVMRATIFYFFKNILDYLNIPLDNKKVLFYVAFILILINPFIIYNTGFQYSFLVTLSIMLCSKLITGSYFKQIFKISLISFLVSLPITVSMNYEVNLLSLILNIFYVPLISLVIFPLSILTFMLPFLSIFLKILITILEISSTFFYHFKFNVNIPKMAILVVIIYYLILYLIYKTKRKKYIYLLIFLLGINYLIPELDKNYYVYYLDVSQGDSSILISPYKEEVIMVDTGGLVNSSYQVSNNTILFLKSLGITKIDYLILTHGDYDHAGETLNILDNLKVKKVIFNNDSYNTLELKIKEELNNQNIHYQNQISNLKWYKNSLEFLNTRMYDNENDNSNVFYMSIFDNDFLFMGDAGVDKEEDIINTYNLTEIDYLKVGHHGSKTSSSKEFIDKINVGSAIISVGKNNRYGHPNKETIENLNGSQIYRTDLMGTICLKINKHKLTVKNYAP